MFQSPSFAKDEEPRTVNHFQFNCWAKTGSVPTSKVALLTLLDLVEQSQHNTGNHPVVVHCQYVFSLFHAFIVIFLTSFNALASDYGCFEAYFQFSTVD